mmetsp:Transcript_1273/g.3237  ORF Transcript_1273/g.3237 Transcript_1273/m.3237 type:complete len:229 (+) Transcript_1273:42-728(+)
MEVRESSSLVAVGTTAATCRGVMLDVSCRSDVVPVSGVVVTGLWLSGDLGEVSIWATATTYRRTLALSAWRCVFSGWCGASAGRWIELDEAIVVDTCETRGVYVHGDAGIATAAVESPERSVLDISRCRVLLGHDDKRDDTVSRAVGRIAYELRHLPWSPGVHAKFPTPYRRAAKTVVLAAHVIGLSIDLAEAILTFCAGDWFGLDPPRGGGGRRAKRLRKIRGARRP